MTKEAKRQFICADCCVNCFCVQWINCYVNRSDRIATIYSRDGVDDSRCRGEYMTKEAERKFVCANCGIDCFCVQWINRYVDCSDRIATVYSRDGVDDCRCRGEHMTKEAERQFVCADCGIDCLSI